MIHNDLIISNTYNYRLSNKIQFSKNIGNIKIQNYEVVLNSNTEGVDGFQIKIEGLNQEESRLKSDRLAKIFMNGIIAESSPPTFFQKDLFKIDHTYKSGKITHTIYKSTIVTFNIEGNLSIINNNLQSLVNDNSKHELLGKITNAIKSSLNEREFFNSIDSLSSIQLEGRIIKFSSN